MIEGIVDSRPAPVVDLAVGRGPGSTFEKRELFLLDTGFNGFVWLRGDLWHELGSEEDGWVEDVETAVSLASVRACLVTVLLGDAVITCPAFFGGANSLIGMKLLDGYRVLIDASVGGLVQIAPT